VQQVQQVALGRANWASKRTPLAQRGPNSAGQTLVAPTFNWAPLRPEVGKRTAHAMERAVLMRERESHWEGESKII